MSTQALTNRFVLPKEQTTFYRAYVLMGDVARRKK